jgi:hypothetical protein
LESSITSGASTVSLTGAGSGVVISASPPSSTIASSPSSNFEDDLNNLVLSFLKKDMSQAHCYQTSLTRISNKEKANRVEQGLEQNDA